MTSLTPLRFFETRLTDEEQLAVASSADPTVRLFVLKFTMAERILSTDFAGVLIGKTLLNA